MFEIKNRIAAIVMTGAMAVSMCGAPMAAMAANGLQDGTQTYDNGVQIVDPDGVADSGDESEATIGWNPAANAGEGGAGQIQIVYSTEGGTWKDPGADPDVVGGDEGTHDNGTFMVVLPKLISYTDMNAGAVSTSDDYTVTVRGFIDGDKKVTLEADASVALVTDEGAGGITATCTQAKNEWSADECFGDTVNVDGSLKGTSCTDNISLSGVAKTAGAYKGSIQYTANLVNV